MKIKIYSVIMLCIFLFSNLSIVSLATNIFDLKNNNEDYSILWNFSCEGHYVFSSNINNDGIPDIIAGSYAIDGKTGKKIYEFEAGKVIAVKGPKIISYDDCHGNNQEVSQLYCLDSSNGKIIWSKELESAFFFHVAIGSNEIVVCTGDFAYRDNDYVYYLNLNDGNIKWKKYTDGYSYSSTISDINSDGKKEIIVTTGGTVNSVNGYGYVYCFNTEGNILWEIKEKFKDFRISCIDNLNSNSFKEILVESGNGIQCLNGKTGNVLWKWSTIHNQGSIQSINTADLINEYPGNEIIIGGVEGVFCIRGNDELSSDERLIWKACKDNNIIDYIVMSVSTGDLDKDEKLDVIAGCMGFMNSDPISLFAIDGQSGMLLWEYENWGQIENYNSGLLCTDLTGDNYPEVIAKDNVPSEFGGTPDVKAIISNVFSKNYPPNKPKIEKINENDKKGYKATTIDPNGHNIFYKYKWEDGSESNWYGPYNSGESCVVEHKFASNIKVKAKDDPNGDGDPSDGLDSSWSDPTARNKNLIFERLLSRLQIFLSCAKKFIDIILS